MIDETITKVLIADGTLYSRYSSKRVELLARVHDHNSGRYVRGFSGNVHRLHVQRHEKISWMSLISAGFFLVSSAIPVLGTTCTCQIATFPCVTVNFDNLPFFKRETGVLC